MGNWNSLSITRKPLSKKLRYQVFTRDHQTCQYCGAKAPEARLTIDHVIPVSVGGDNELDNLRTACWDCNAGKGIDESYANQIRYERLINSLNSFNCFSCGKEEPEYARFEQSLFCFSSHLEFSTYIEIHLCLQCIQESFASFINDQIQCTRDSYEQIKILKHKLNPQWGGRDERVD